MAHKQVLFLLILSLVCCNTSSGTSPEAEILIKFKSSLSHNTAFDNWNASVTICNNDGHFWSGVTCKDKALFGLRLENMSLSGVIDIDALVNLTSLRSLSFMNNSFHGTMPPVRKLGALRALYLAYNKFSGKIPDDAFEGMRSLKTVRLEENGFKGQIPGSLASLPALVELSLEGNKFEGQIPDFIPRAWKLFNLSNNQLEGPIPSGLSNLDSNSFAGNEDLCGHPLRRCKSQKKWQIITGVTVGVIVIAIIVIYHRYRRRRRRRAPPSAAEQVEDKLGLTKAQNAEPTEENAKLQFVRADRPIFDLDELLRAPAEVLGGGSFGSAYKALLLNGPPVVVKRLRPMRCVGFEEFQEHMKRLGTISHPNLLSPLAFYYRNEDKLLISEFIGNGNLAAHLHGHAQGERTPSNIGLDWPTRLRILKGVGRGLAHLHTELPSQALPHGHLKSSNILLSSNFEPLLTDFGLHPLVGEDQGRQFMAAYKSPEYIRHRRVSKKTDVWSLGILILELLTGKFPANYLRHGGGSGDLAAWVKSAVREEWTAEVFDGDMIKGSKNEGGEMMRLLRIGMVCCEAEEDGRWGLKEVVEKIEELKEMETFSTEDDFYSSYASELDVSSLEKK